MRIVRLDDGGVTRLLLRGELDLDTGDLFEEHAARALGDRPAELVVDMDGLTFCDSSGIDVLVAARETAVRAGIGFRVHRPHGIVRRSLTVTGVYELLVGGTPGPGPARESVG
ncbi:STAS domain-containing protein [Actinoplanes subglobosus]|uniref:STAS domain-containing protein n=1 Tax=Actinoplanes subglobosus TaxID=1547892 RepID=A0ABV8J3E1_9ACTN